MGNRKPVFYTPNVQIVAQKLCGKEDHPDSQHISMRIAVETVNPDPHSANQPTSKGYRGIAWRWGGYYPLPERVDVAYHLQENSFTNNSGKVQTSVELEVVGLRPAWKPQLIYRPAPDLNHCPDCVDLRTAPRPLPRRLLLYGYDRPLAKFLPKAPAFSPAVSDADLKSEPPPDPEVDLDRPLSKQVYASLVLWSLPPSMTHLRWLIATTQSPSDRPLIIYVGRAIPPLPQELDFMTKLMALLPTSSLSVPQPLDLLRLAQEWWVSPAVIVAGLRSLGYDCGAFPATRSLTEELQRLERWYQMDGAKLQLALGRYGHAP
jgi:single-stranded-DNA-specific exonuclease